MRLKELADKILGADVVKSCEGVDGSNQPPFWATVEIYDADDYLLYVGSSRGARSIKEAEEAAAAAALRNAGLDGGSAPATAAVSLSPAPATNARMRLKELADKVPGSEVLKSCKSYGLSGPNQPPFRASVVVVTNGGCKVLYSGKSGDAWTVKEAEEAAAADALRKAGAGDDGAPAAVRAEAWLGDAAQEFILALLGTRAGLTAAQLDHLSQTLLSNEALAAGAPEQLVSVTLTATEAEAKLGRRVTADTGNLLTLLLPALREANPALDAALRRAVKFAAL